MRASLLPNGNLVGTGEASRQSLSQSPVLGRHGNKQRGAREMGERSQREAGRCTIISDPVTCSGRDTQPCGHPVCFTDQRTQSLLSSSVPLTQTGSTSPHMDTHPHTLLTHPHSPTLTHTYSSHTLIHHLHTPHTLYKHIHSSHPHTPSHIHTLTHSHTHTLHTHTHTHTPSHTPHLYTYTHIHTHNHRAYRSEDTGNTGTQGQCSHTRHVEHVGTAQSPS